MRHVQEYMAAKEKQMNSGLITDATKDKAGMDMEYVTNSERLSNVDGMENEMTNMSGSNNRNEKGHNGTIKSRIRCEYGNIS